MMVVWHEPGPPPCGHEARADAGRTFDGERVDKVLLTVGETAEVLGVSRNKVFQLLARNELASVKIDRCRRVPVAAIRDFVARLSNAKGTSNVASS